MSQPTRPHRSKCKVVIRDRNVAVYWQMFEGPPDAPANRDIPREPATAFEWASLVSHVVPANRTGWYQQFSNVPRFLRAEDVVLLEEAEAYFGAKIAAEPAERAWRELRAHARLEQGDRAGALADIDALRGTMPEAEWFMLRADWHRRLEDGPAALADAAAAVEIAPQDRRAIHLQASLQSEFAPQEAVGSMAGLKFLQDESEPLPRHFTEFMELNALIQAGRLDEAEQRINAASTPLERAQLAGQAAMTMHSAGQGARAAGIVQRSLDELAEAEEAGPLAPMVRAHLLNTLALLPGLGSEQELAPELRAAAERAATEGLRQAELSQQAAAEGSLPREFSEHMSQSNRSLSLMLRAQHRRELGDLPGAAEDYLALVDLQQADLLTRGELVKVLLDLGRYDDARPHVAWLVEQAPFEETWLAQTRLALHDHDLDLALWAIDEALSVGHESANLLNYRASIHGQRGERDAELADLTRAIEISSEPDACLFVNRGAYFLHTHQPAEALADFNRALELEPECAIALRNRSALYSRAGMFREALADVERALTLEPDHKFGLNNRAWCLLFAPADLRNPEQAMADIRRCLALPWPRFSIPMATRTFDSTLAAALAAQGEHAQAAKLLEACLTDERDPDDRRRYEEMLAAYRQAQPYTPRPEFTW